MGQLISVSNNHPTVNIFKPLRLKDGMRLCRQWNTWVLWHWQCDTALCQALYLPGPIQYSFTCENTCTTAFSISWKVTFNKDSSVLPFEALGSWEFLFHAHLRLSMPVAWLNKWSMFFLFVFFYSGMLYVLKSFL